MYPRKRGFACLAAFGFVALLGGCSSSTGNGSNELSADQTADMSATAVDEAGSVAEGFSPGGTLDPAATSFAVAAAPGFSANLVGPPHASCATVSSATDGDADGVPDSAVYTYALPACEFTNFDGGTLSLSGQVTVVDPTPAAADLARKVTLANFAWGYQNADNTKTYTVTRNGTRTFTGNAAGLTLSTNVTADREVPGKLTATIVHNVQWNFTPAQGSTIQPGMPIPSGTIAGSGTLTFSRGTDSRTFTVSTPTPLSYDSTCTGPRRDRIAAGELHWTLPSGGYIKIVWSGCGVPPTRTFVPAA